MTRIHAKMPEAPAPSSRPLGRPTETTQPVPEEKPKLLDRLSDKFDQAVGLDTTGPKPITLTGVTEAHFQRMDAKVQEMEARTSTFDEDTRKRLEAGEIVSTWQARPDGATEHVTRGLIDMRLDDFLLRMPIEDWGKHLAGYKGGEVQKFGSNRQLERMVLRMPGKDLDITKVETLSRDCNRQGQITVARVRWEVLKTDNGTSPMDVGYLKLERFGDKTLVTWNSAHKFNKFPALTAILPEAAREAATGMMVTSTFRQHTEAYRHLAER